MSGLDRRLGHSSDCQPRGPIRAKGRFEEVDVGQVGAVHEAGGAVKGFFPFEPEKKPVTETGRPPDLPELVDAREEGDVFQPGAGHVAGRQQKAVSVNQKCRSFRLVAVKDGFTLSKPILRQNKGDRGSILIGVTLQNYSAFSLSET